MQQGLEAILPPGFKFRPTKEELVGYYLFNKIKSTEVPYGDLFIKRCDLYGKDEPSDIWNAFRDSDGDDDEDLYFYTDLKRKRANGYRIDRTVGSSGQGTWHGESFGVEFQVKVKVEEPDQYRWLTGYKKRFSYRNAESKQNGMWIMHEFGCSVKPDTVLCVLKRSAKAAAVAAADNSSSKKRTFSAEFEHQSKIARIDHHVEPAAPAVLSIVYPDGEQLNHNPAQEVDETAISEDDEELQRMPMENFNYDGCSFLDNSVDYEETDRVQHEQELNGLVCINNNDSSSIPGVPTEEGGDYFVQMLENLDCIYVSWMREFDYEGYSNSNFKPVDDVEHSTFYHQDHIANIDDCVKPPDPAVLSIDYPNFEQLKGEQELNGLVCINNNDSSSIPGAPTKEGGHCFLQMRENLDCSDISWMREFEYDGDRTAEGALMTTDQQINNGHDEACDITENGRNESSHSIIDTPWAYAFSKALLQANPAFLLSQDNEIAMIPNRFYMESAGLLSLSSKD